MKQPREDDERLSALIEGQVRGRERDELLAHVAASDDDYEVFTDTAAVLQALEDEDARAAAADGVIPLQRPRAEPRFPGRWLALAASIAAVALISALALRTRGSKGHEPLQLAAAVDSAGRGLPVDWTLPSPSDAVRGAADDASAVLAGARLVDLSVAARAGDTARTRLLAKQLSDRNEPGASGSALQQIAERPAVPPDSLNQLLERATDRLEQLDRKHVQLGAWIEAARLAARGQDADFFRSRSTGGMLGRAERLAGDDAAARAAVDGVRAALRADGPRRWDSLETSLTALLSELGS